jgi:hypothetical protein
MFWFYKNLKNRKNNNSSYQIVYDIGILLLFNIIAIFVRNSEKMAQFVDHNIDPRPCIAR